MNAHRVIHSGDGTEQDQYRKAVAQIIGDIQRATKLDMCLIADAIEVDKKTILNAFNKRSDLGAIYLKRLGCKFGGAFLNPYLALIGIQATPIDPKAARDILPLATKVSHKVACARDPAGPGGAVEVPQERAAYLPDLKQLHHEAGCLIPQIEAAL